MVAKSVVILYLCLSTMTLSSVGTSRDCWRQGKRKDHLPPYAVYFLIIAIFIGMSSGCLCGGESYNDKIFMNGQLFS